MARKQHDSNFRPKTYVVRDTFGETHEITAHYAFDNGAEGVTLRRHIEDDREKKTGVVMHFAKHAISWYKEQDNG